MENNALPVISNIQLAISFIPAMVVLAVFYAWTIRCQTIVYAFARMTIQLILVGYVLTYLFGTNHSLIVVAVMILMILISSWITLRPLKSITYKTYLHALIAIAIAGTATIFLVTEFVLELDPWFRPQYMIPLAGLVYSNAMNTVSLTAERFEVSLQSGSDYYEARLAAMNAGLIPVINTLLATGLVSLPGIMTGQILSGVSPLIAVRYQIVIMCMVFAAGGGAAAIYLLLEKRESKALAKNNGI